MSDNNRDILDYNRIDDDVTFVKGVGPRRASVLKKHGISTVYDLLLYTPRDYIDRRNITPINQLTPNTKATILAEVESYGMKFIRGGKKMYIVNVTDKIASLELIWFRNVKYFEGLFKEGDLLYISGKTSRTVFPQMVHPEFEFLFKGKEPLHTIGLVPLYPTTAELKKISLDSRGFRKIIKSALNKYIDALPDDLNPRIEKTANLISHKDAISLIHFPKTHKEIASAKRRLAFSELFYVELLLALQKRRNKLLRNGIKFKKAGELVSRLGKYLPFKLTSAQRRVIKDIFKDMNSPRVMRRLLQGDVGSGKTIVAALSCALAVENGYKSAVMVPTEVLAEQHYINFAKLFNRLKIETTLLTKSSRNKNEIYEKLKSDKECIVIGTHALIQEKVDINRLGLIVIDEQHRFGVRQRLDLISQNQRADLLVMTATPIPRSLAMTLYGDFDISIIDEMPPGRKRIKTLLAQEGSEHLIFDKIFDYAKRGEQVYIIYPLVEKSEKIDLRAAVDAYEKLKKTTVGKFGIGLLYGKMDMAEKSEVLDKFNRGEIKILISTTVVEVGIDSPKATLMVIIGAERFGLSQLHQLRGRVGRGESKAECILKLTHPPSDIAKQRIQAMLSSNNGFEIAEFDLKIRGPGEFLGVKQHGFPNFKFADITSDMELLRQARESAFQLISEDPKLELPENQTIKDYLRKRFRGVFRFADTV